MCIRMHVLYYKHTIKCVLCEWGTHLVDDDGDDDDDVMMMMSSSIGYTFFVVPKTHARRLITAHSHACVWALSLDVFYFFVQHSRSVYTPCKRALSPLRVSTLCDVIAVARFLQPLESIYLCLRDHWNFCTVRSALRIGIGPANRRSVRFNQTPKWRLWALAHTHMYMGARIRNVNGPTRSSRNVVWVI